MTLDLFAYQAEAADIMCSRDRFGLHDEMGIGKTATTIGAINRILGSRGMIVCPAMLRANWLREWEKFSKYDLRVCKGKDQHDFIAWRRGRFDMLITSYEQATNWASDFKRDFEVLDFLVFDEAHYLKNQEAQRTKALLGNGETGLVEFAEYSWHVTGTPMSNDPMDIYTFLRFAKAIDLEREEFVRYFFERRPTKFGFRHFTKSHMVGTLQALIANNSIRRTHKDVGMYLPPIWLKEVLIEGDANGVKQIADAVKEYPHLEAMIIYAIENEDLSLLDAPHIATLRRLVGKVKAVAYSQMLKWELDAGAAKRVAFFVHTEPLLYLRNFLQKHGYQCVVAYGDTPEVERQDAVKRFMEDPNVSVFLGNMRVAGVGLTLTESSEIDIVESDWSPANNAQAIKRVHRYGQTEEVHGRFITLAKSIDEVVNRIVAQKTANIAEIEGFSMAAAPLDVLERST